MWSTILYLSSVLFPFAGISLIRFYGSRKCDLSFTLMNHNIQQEKALRQVIAQDSSAMSNFFASAFENLLDICLSYLGETRECGINNCNKNN